MRKRAVRLWVLPIIVTGFSAALLAQQPACPPAPSHPTLALWPHGAPSAVTNPAPEADTTTAKDNLVAGKPVIRLGNVSTPTLTLYEPKGKNTGGLALNTEISVRPRRSVYNPASKFLGSAEYYLFW